MDIWIFNGENGRFPSAIFDSKKKALVWIEKESLSGTLTKYPINFPIYDWAISNRFFSPKSTLQCGAKTKANFNSAYLEHYHFQDGKFSNKD